MRTAKRKYGMTLLAFLACSALSACGAPERLAGIGKPPPMTALENPQLRADYRPVSMPMPPPHVVSRQPNSLWDANRQTFFKDQRAVTVGDILTVLISIDDKGKLDDETKRSRNQGETAGMPDFFGLETKLGKVFPDATDPAKLVDLSSTSAHDGKGSVDRKEQINVKLAAMITQTLPNGNFVIHGSQEVLVNFEKRLVAVDGIIRPQDVSVNNSVTYDQIAEARITYGGNGQLTDVQQPRYGQQVFDVISPF